MYAHCDSHTDMDVITVIECMLILVAYGNGCSQYGKEILRFEKGVKYSVPVLADDVGTL